MVVTKIIDYICILLGAIVALYAQAEAEQNSFVLIGGIVLLMFGLYRVSRNIPSKNQEALDNNDNENEE